jgi:hypothetical protein
MQPVSWNSLLSLNKYDMIYYGILIKRKFVLIKFFFKIIVSWLLLIGLLVSYVFIDFDGNSPQKKEQPTIVNDITQLNPIEVTRVIQPTSIEDIIGAIQSSTGPISIGGGRFSQGGKIAYPDSIHVDMRAFNKVLAFDATKKQVTVQSGITWRDLQEIIDTVNLSIKKMQTYANFTVGGSLSVNVHGRYIGEGPIIRSVESIKLIKANGEIVNASPTENSTLFYGTIGGYGGIAVIAEENTCYETTSKGSLEKGIELPPLYCLELLVLLLNSDLLIILIFVQINNQYIYVSRWLYCDLNFLSWWFKRINI